MALADILDRIERDADEETFCIVDEAKREAEWLVDQARGEAEELTERIVAEANTRAERESETTRANARLQARDRAVAARRELAGRVLRRAEEALADLSDDRYAALIAERVVAAARGDETVRVAREDDRLVPLLAAAVEEAASASGRSLDLSVGEPTDDITAGVLLAGDRMTVEVSPRALVRERHEEMLALAAARLFPEHEAPTQAPAAGELGEYG